MTLLFFAGCKKEETKTEPVITIPVLSATKAVTDITQTTASSGGKVTSDGGSAVTARGVCYGKSPEPNISGSKTENGAGVGDFGSSLTGLEANTTYYVRAYATNPKGTSYGVGVSFNTLEIPVTIPILGSTTSAINITQTTATSGGIISSAGNGIITARGVCWGTSPEPTISNAKSEDGEGKGSFISNLTGLMEGTTYYVRSYATNTAGTGYGSQTSFTTSASIFNPNLTYGNMTDQEGNSYKTIQIGTQVWMAENLKTTRYRDGSAITTGLSNNAWELTIAGAYAIYENNAANNTTYGKLYNWYAVADSRNLCPAGWHVPSDGEWTTLENFLGGSTVAGGKMKTTTGWNDYNGQYGKGTNESGFSGLPGGGRYGNGTYDAIGNFGNWWSSTEYSSANAGGRYLFYYYGFSYRLNFLKREGFSVRCLRD
jgi:uncharacterized protein (TIGR02145 family)